MFTIEQIEEASFRVKRGADFPQLVQDLIAIGVIANDTVVIDGHAVYFGEDDYIVKTGQSYPELELAYESDDEKFRDYLKAHQHGKTDHPTFCRHSAETGVEKWRLDFTKMTCTYFDRSENVLLVEKIPSI